MAEKTSLPIEVVDKFSKPLADLQRRLNALEARRNVSDTTDKIRDLRGTVRAASERISYGLRDALSGLGLAAGGTSLAIAAVTSSVRQFSFGVGELRAFSRETGFTVNAIRVLESSAIHFQVAPDAVRSGLKTFSANLYDFRRNYGEVHAQILRLAPDLTEQLKKASPDKALDLALDYVARIPNRMTAGRISTLLFGTDQVARFGQNGVEHLRRTLREVYARIGNVSKDDERKAEAFEQAVNRMRSSLEGLGKTVAVEVSPHLVPLVQRLDEFIRTNQGEIGSGLGKAIEQIAAGARAFNSAIEGSIGWDGLVKGLIAVKLLQTAAAIGAVASGLRGVAAAAQLPALMALIANPAAAAAIAFVATVSMSAGRGRPYGVGPEDGSKGSLALQAELQQVEGDILGALANKDPARVAELQMRAAALRALIKEGAEQGVKNAIARATGAQAGPSMGVGATPHFGGGGSTPAGTGGVSGGGGATQGTRGGGGSTSGGVMPPGNTAPGLQELKKATENLPGGRARITAENDRFHHGLNYRSQHTRGLAFDQVLKDGSKHAEAAEFIRARMRAAGLSDKDFRVLDEYAKPSPFSTGPHIHSQFNSPEAAKKFADFYNGGTPGTAYKAAQGAGVVDGPSAAAKRPTLLDIQFGSVAMPKGTNDAPTLFRPVQLNSGRSMIQAGAEN